MTDIQVIHPNQLETEVSSGTMTRLAGVSRGLVGAEGIHLAIATVPPGCQSTAHKHTNCESAIYITKGHGKMNVVNGIKESCDIFFYDTSYIP